MTSWAGGELATESGRETVADAPLTGLRRAGGDLATESVAETVADAPLTGLRRRSLVELRP
jgi:hypothetical protein